MATKVKKPITKNSDAAKRIKIRPATLTKNEKTIIETVYSGQPCRTLTDEEMHEARLRMQAARYMVGKRMPYFNMAFTSMTFIMSEHCPAVMAVDKHWRCYVRPDAILLMEMEDIAGVFQHEAYHLILNHPKRGEEMGVDESTHFIANIAADLVVNPLTLENKYKLPSFTVMPKDFGLENGWSYDAYYNWLIRNMPEISVEILIGAGKGVANGSGGSGVKQEYEDQTPDDSQGDSKDGKSKGGAKFDNPSDAPRVNDMHGEIIRNECARALQEHVSKNPGSVPSELVVWSYSQLAPPKIPWWREFRAMVRGEIARGNMDETFTKRHPHQQMYGRMVVPGTIAYSPIVGVNSDTSGSMHGLHDIAMAEINGLTKHVENIYHVSCDADVHTAKRVNDVRKIKLVGGGGTDMNRGLDYFAKMHPVPTLVITVTDGYCSWTDKRYPFKHICVMLTKDGQKPPFGKVIYVDPDDYK